MKTKSNFYLRRLHSFTGIVPIGIFLTMHILENVSELLGDGNKILMALAQVVESPVYNMIKILCLVFPLAFHMIYGIYICTKTKSDVKNYKTVDSFKFYAQRVTGFISILFGLSHMRPPIMESMDNPLVFTLYLIGTFSIIFHFTNGIFSASMTWGFCIGEKEQKKLKIATNILFIILCTGATIIAILL